MELRFIEADTIFDVQIYESKVTIENLHKEFVCRFVSMYGENSILVSSKENLGNLEFLGSDRIFVFNFFRGAYGYKFMGRTAEPAIVDSSICIEVFSNIEQYSRRKAPRLDLIAPVHVFAAGADGFKAELICTESSLDISRGGMAVVTNAKLGGIIEKGKEYFLDFKLAEQYFSLRATLVHSGNCTVISSYKFLYAFEFKNHGNHEKLADAIFAHRLRGT